MNKRDAIKELDRKIEASKFFAGNTLSTAFDVWTAKRRGLFDERDALIKQVEAEEEAKPNADPDDLMFDLLSAIRDSQDEGGIGTGALRSALAAHGLVVARGEPEALAALKLLLREVELSGNADAKDYGWPAAIKATRAAISRATGG